MTKCAAGLELYAKLEYAAVRFYRGMPAVKPGEGYLASKKAYDAHISSCSVCQAEKEGDK